MLERKLKDQREMYELKRILPKITDNRLKELRYYAEKSASDVSKYTGISIRMISNYENCVCNIPAYNLVKLADYYGVTTDYILNR